MGHTMNPTAMAMTIRALLRVHTSIPGGLIGGGKRQRLEMAKIDARERGLLGMDWAEDGWLELGRPIPMARHSRPDSLLYHRPLFTRHQNLFSDLTLYATALPTTGPCSPAVLEAQPEQDT